MWSVCYRLGNFICSHKIDTEGNGTVYNGTSDFVSDSIISSLRLLTEFRVPIAETNKIIWTRLHETVLAKRQLRFAQYVSRKLKWISYHFPLI